MYKFIVPVETTKKRRGSLGKPERKSLRKRVAGHRWLEGEMEDDRVEGNRIKLGGEWEDKRDKWFREDRGCYGCLIKASKLPLYNIYFNKKCYILYNMLILYFIQEMYINLYNAYILEII